MQLAHGGHHQMCPHLVGHWMQGICCARGYMHMVRNQMRVRSCREIFYMRFNCRCTHAIVLQKHVFIGQLVAVFSSLIFAGSLTFYDSGIFLQTRKLTARVMAGFKISESVQFKG